MFIPKGVHYVKRSALVTRLFISCNKALNVDIIILELLFLIPIVRIIIKIVPFSFLFF